MVQFSLKAFYNELNWLKVNRLQNSAEVATISKNNVHCEYKVLFANLSVCAKQQQQQQQQNQQQQQREILLFLRRYQ